MGDITQFPGTEQVPAFESLVKKMKLELPANIEYLTMRAILTRRYYEELRGTGFSEKEALELCTKW